MCAAATPHDLFGFLAVGFLSAALVLSVAFAKRAHMRCVRRYPNFWISFVAGVNQMGTGFQLVSFDPRDEPVVRQHQWWLGLSSLVVFALVAILFLFLSRC